MHSKSFVSGFHKTAGILAPLGWVAKKAVKASGGPLSAALTGLGAVSEGLQGYNKMTAAATR